MIWLLTIVGLLSCFQFKRADYLLPAYPGAALFLGCAAERGLRLAKRPGYLIATVGVIVAGCTVGWWVYLGFVLPQSEPALEYRRFAEEIRRRAPAPQLILFFRAEAHALAFHVGRPIDTLLEWENLDVWAGRPETYIVMPPECAAAWSWHLKSGSLMEVLRNTDLAAGWCSSVASIRTTNWSTEPASHRARTEAMLLADGSSRACSACTQVTAPAVSLHRVGSPTRRG